MNMRLLAGLLFAVSVVGFSLGASLPLVSLRLHEAGASTLEIGCLLYTSPSPRDRQKSRMPSSA